MEALKPGANMDPDLNYLRDLSRRRKWIRKPGRRTVKYVAVIPARLASTRLPRKPLREIAGKTMIARVYEAVAASKLVSETIVATDAREVVEHCEKLGIPRA